MSFIPDTRNDDCYNYDFLNEMGKEFINGADWMLEEIVNLFLGNLDVYEGELEIDTEIDVDKFLDLAKEEISEMIKDWAETQRDEMITSMIDSMDDDEYEEIRNKALKENDKKYYNSLKFALRGVKERSNND